MSSAYDKFKPRFEAEGEDAIENTLEIKCFCNFKFEKDKIGFTFLDFSKLPNSNSDRNYCMKFFWKFNFKNIIIIASGSTIALLNVVVIVVSSALSVIEGDKVTGDSSIQKFFRIMTVMFINICLIPIIVTFETSFDDFVPEWYFEVGATLGITLTISIITPHLGRYAFVILGLFIQF